MFAHNAAAIAAYRKAGYAEEGRRVAQYRRASGELWDTIVMGLQLEGPWRTAGDRAGNNQWVTGQFRFSAGNLASLGGRRVPVRLREE